MSCVLNTRDLIEPLPSSPRKRKDSKRKEIYVLLTTVSFIVRYLIFTQHVNMHIILFYNYFVYKYVIYFKYINFELILFLFFSSRNVVNFHRV